MRAIAWLFLFASLVRGDKVLHEETRPGMKLKAVEVVPGLFGRKYVERLALAELQKARDLNFLHLWIYGDKGAAPLPKSSHVSYEQWLGLYEATSKLPNEIAEMIAIRGNAVLRIRDASGAMSTTVLAGRNPLQVELDGDEFEIVYLASNGTAPYILRRVDIYCRTAAPLTKERGLKLLERFQPIFPDVQLSIAIRHDAWFIYESSFPFFSPFGATLNPPTVEEYSGTRTLICGYWTVQPSCLFQ